MTDVAEKPLVTFALFAYNQERYIREAVEAALAQDYPNLEIIISDDCSSDLTFNLISNILSEYSGIHRVIFYKNEENLGLIGSVNKLFSIASGDLIVMAAGDDVSAPGRVSSLVDAWLANGKRADCVYSNCFVVNSNGDVIGSKDISFEAEKSLQDAVRDGVLVLGAVAAWTRRLWLSWGGINDRRVSEDSFLSIRAKLGGGLICVPENLVSYRKGASSWIISPKSASDVVEKGRILSRLIYRNAKSSYRACVSHGDDQLVRFARINLSRAAFYRFVYVGGASFFNLIVGAAVRRDVKLRLALVHIAYKFFPKLVLARFYFNPQS